MIDQDILRHFQAAKQLWFESVKVFSKSSSKGISCSSNKICRIFINLIIFRKYLHFKNDPKKREKEWSWKGNIWESKGSKNWNSPS